MDPLHQTRHRQNSRKYGLSYPSGYHQHLHAQLRKLTRQKHRMWQATLGYCISLILRAGVIPRWRVTTMKVPHEPPRRRRDSLCARSRQKVRSAQPANLPKQRDRAKRILPRSFSSRRLLVISDAKNLSIISETSSAREGRVPTRTIPNSASLKPTRAQKKALLGHQTSEAP